MTIRIATRRSRLAMAQASQTATLIEARTGSTCELVPMSTTGDDHPDRAIGAFDAKGLFVDSIRAAVRDGDVDLAVHSLKDLPTEATEGLVIGAIPVREDPRDLLVTREAAVLSTLSRTAVVGTSSERRKLQLLRARPGLSVLPLRGNLDTRLRKVHDGELDAVVVAFAGLRRLYRPESEGGIGPLGLPITASALEPGECLPAPAQGALAVECRDGDDDALAVCKLIDHGPTRAAVTAERAFLAAIGGGCTAPVGALCTITGMGGLELLGMVGDPGRRRMLRLSLSGGYRDPDDLGRRLADDIRAAGGDDLIAAAQGGRGSGP